MPSYRPFPPLISWLFIAATGLASLSCSKNNDDPTDGPNAATTPITAESAMTKPKNNLLAEWHSFSYNPPLYGVEKLLIYDDFSCAVTASSDNSNTPCSWKRVSNDRMILDFPGNKSEVATSLRPALSTEGKKHPETAGYLIIDLSKSHRQLFVLANSEDDRMVQDTVNGERNWNAGNYDAGVKDLRSAQSQGSMYARIRLGWIYATNKEFYLPALALKLLDPLRVNDKNYGVMNALAAAYAANSQYDKAVKTAETACALASAEEKDGCRARLSHYRTGQPLITLVQP